MAQSATAEPVRLVIWDLDETFWRGTLTEGGVTAFVEEHHDLVVTLAKRGILSSICSKNDFETVRAILIEKSLWDYFVFPSIDWSPKGPRIARLVETIGLRPPTVMFIDDNPGNLAEVQSVVPGIQVANETFIPQIQEHPLFKGKDDSTLTRLAQYKLLEKRKADEISAGSDNTGFLRSSNIRVFIEHDVEAHLDRAIELVNRTNQLNFTKRRLPEDIGEARALLLKDIRAYNVQAGLVRVVDNYGDYGHVGFFLRRGAWTKYELVHFCFSCRTLGMKVERWVYDWLERPTLRVVGEALTDLDEPMEVDWVRPVDRAGLTAEVVDGGDFKIPAVRLRGGCDLEALAHYLRLSTGDLTTEFNIVRDGASIRVDHSLMLMNALKPLTAAELALAEPLAFRAEDFQSRFFDPAPAGSIWIYSAWADAKWFVYRHRETGVRLPYGTGNLGHTDLTRAEEGTLEQVLSAQNLSEETRAAVREALPGLRRDFICEAFLGQRELHSIYSEICRRVPKDGHLFIILGNEIGIHDGKPVVRQAVDLMNKAIMEAAREYANVSLLHLRDFVKSDAEIQGADHFDRMVYFRVYEHIIQQQNGAVVEQRADVAGGDALGRGVRLHQPSSPQSDAA